LSKPWSKEAPLSAPRYDDLLREFHQATDKHERYALASLVRWHVPVPWASWAAFRVNYRPNEPEPPTNHTGGGRS